MNKYNSYLEINDLNSSIILSNIFKIININSAIDIGCCKGSWLLGLKKLGVQELYGVDGDWNDKTSVCEIINPENYYECDLDKTIFKLNKKFDLAICLEVAEHINNFNNVISTLVGLSDVILFSAAIPNQGGQNHVNEQWPSYWKKLFNEQNYEFLDIIRPYIWDDKRIFKWYR
jgi:2-polyprenyl-3-methyl-5-hydroxy-6-metoxy-1,4-benzoquinol methylase